METIGLIAGLATEVMKFVNNQAMKKHNERMLELQKDIAEEKKLGQNSDDGKIEDMEKEFMLESQAFLNQLALMAVGK